MKFRAISCFATIVLVIHFSCVFGASPEAVKPNVQTVSPRALIFAFPGYASRETITKRFTPFVDYLAKTLKRKVILKVLSNYFEVLEQLEKDSVDLAQLTPVLYSSVMDSDDIEFLGVQVVKGDFFYQSQIVVPAGSPINDISQLRGKTIGFTNIFSGSGFIVPMLELKEKGLITASGEKLFESKMLDNHDKLIYNLLKNRVDAAATYGDMVEESKEPLRVIHKIAMPIPQDAFVANLSTLDDELLKSIREAFRNFWDKTGKSYIERFHANDRIYQDFRKIVKP